MKFVKSDMIRSLITEAENISDREYCDILDKDGPIKIGGFVFMASDLLRGRGQMFDDSKAKYIESIVKKLKADLKAEIDLIFDEEVIF